MNKFQLKFFLPLLVLCLLKLSLYSQNVGISIQAENAGKIQIGNSIYLKLYISNTSPTLTLNAYKIRPLFFIPSIISVAPTGHIMPAGWTLLSSDAGSFRLSNGTGTIPPNTQREILIKIQGIGLGGPSVVQANMQFASGSAPGTNPGPPTSGNLTADDAASVNIEVLETLPVTLAEFNASIVNCQGLIVWTTKTEQNSDQFVVEKSVDIRGTGHWTSLGSVAAAGTSFREIKYSFVDKSPAKDARMVFYRLKTIDKDGSFRYSRIITMVNSCQFKQIMVYPNPVINEKMFINATGLSSITQSTLLNSSGQVIKKQLLTNGLNILNLHGVAAGMYVITITNNEGFTQSMKVIVQ